MDHSAALTDNDHQGQKPKRAELLGWQEFFERLGQGTLIAQQREAPLA